MNGSNLPGYGDEVTWPPYCGAPGDPREIAPATDEVETAQDFISEIREQIDRAETAVFRRDWDTYSLAMLSVHSLTGSMFP